MTVPDTNTALLLEAAAYSEKGLIGRLAAALAAAEAQRDEALSIAERELDALRQEIANVRLALIAAEERADELREALGRIAERIDVDVNGEYAVHDQPAMSSSAANVLARAALARVDGERG